MTNFNVDLWIEYSVNRKAIENNFSMQLPLEALERGSMEDVKLIEALVLTHVQKYVAGMIEITNWRIV